MSNFDKNEIIFANLLVTVSALFAVLAYAPLLESPFYYDDLKHIVSNPAIMGSDFWDVFRLNFWGQSISADSVWSYRPVATLVNRLSFGMGGVIGVRFSNLLLHISLGIFLYLIFLKYTKPITAAFIAGVFMVHPIQSENVTMAIGKAEILAAIFCVGMAFAFIKEKKAISVILFGCAIFCKESAVLVLIPAFMYGICLKRWNSIFKVTFEFMPHIAFGLFSFWMHFVVTGLYSDDIGIIQNPLIAADGIMSVFNRLAFPALYLARFLVPINIPADFSAGSDIVRSLSDPILWLAVIMSLALPIVSLFTFLKYKNISSRLFFVSTSIYFTMGLIAFQWHGLGAFALADRHLYISLIGAAFMLSILIRSFAFYVSGLLGFSATKLTNVIMIAFLLFFALMLFPAAVSYSDPLTLAKAWKTNSPGGVRAYLMVGNELAKKGYLNEALNELNRASLALPDYVGIELPKAKMLSQLNREEEAGIIIQKLYQHHSDKSDVAYSMGVWLWRSGRLLDALEVLEKASSKWNTNATIKFEYGRLKAELEGPGFGLTIVEQAFVLSNKPEYLSTAIGLRISFIEKLIDRGRMQEALVEFNRKSVAILPNKSIVEFRKRLKSN